MKPKRTREPDALEYGRLVVLGYSSYRVETEAQAVERATAKSKSTKHKISMGNKWEPLGDQNAQYVLRARRGHGDGSDGGEAKPTGNGVTLKRFHHFYDTRLTTTTATAGATSGANQDTVSKVDVRMATKRMMHTVEAKSEDPRFLMCVPMHDQHAHASVIEYASDPSHDLFQIGRMPCAQNDFVIPGPRVGASGTISRIAARLQCSREPPYECRVFAGGFDSSRRMTTAAHALKRCVRCESWLKKVPADHECVHDLLNGVIDSEEPQQQNDPDHDPVCTGSCEQIDLETRTTSKMDVAREPTVTHVEMDVTDAAQLPLDGLTKNGVRVWLPDHRQWFEVSVTGNLYEIEPQISAAESTLVNADPSASGKVAPPLRARRSSFNRPNDGCAGIAPVLVDGAIIDLGGVQLQFQSRWSAMVDPLEDARASSMIRASWALQAHKDRRINSSNISMNYTDPEDGDLLRESSLSIVSKLERMNVQCPVQLHTLRFRLSTSAATRKKSNVSTLKKNTAALSGSNGTDFSEKDDEELHFDQVPHVFPACGHVFGYEERIASSRLCPMCRTPGPFVQLLLKDNFHALAARCERTAPVVIPECVLNPCGHAISQSLATRYAGLVMPNGSAICPFCAAHLDKTKPFSRLYLYSEDDDEDTDDVNGGSNSDSSSGSS